MSAARPPLRALDDALDALLAHARPLAADSGERRHLRGRRPRAGRGPGLAAAGSAAGQQLDGRLRGAQAPEIADEGVPLPVSQRIPARCSAPRRLQPGTVRRASSPAPRCLAGADAIVMQEDDARRWTTAACASCAVPAAGQWIRRSGEDITAAAPCWHRGERIGPAAQGLAAGHRPATALQVARRPRVALFSTGDELVMPGQVRARGHEAGRHLQLQPLLPAQPAAAPARLRGAATSASCRTAAMPPSRPLRAASAAQRPDPHQRRRVRSARRTTSSPPWSNSVRWTCGRSP